MLFSACRTTAIAVILGGVLAFPALGQRAHAQAAGTGADPATGESAALRTLTQFAEFGEPDYPEGFEHFNYVNPEAPKGGEIRLSAFGTFVRLDTIVLGPGWPQGIGLTGDTLMTGSSDELDAYYPSIATSVEVPEDVSFAIFNIDPRARWHDGEPITAGDFVFAVDHIQEHGRPLLRDFWKVIASAEALDDHRLKVTFTTKGNWKTLGLAASLSPMPVHFIEAEGIDVTKPTLKPMLSEGAYEIEKVDAGRSITYRRIDDYWAADLPVNRGINNFDRITYVYFRDLDVAFEAFKAGDFDLWAENKAQRWVSGYDFDAVKKGLVIRDEESEIATPRGFAGIVMNTRRPQLADVHVRQGLAELFDFEWIQKNIFYGLYDRARSWFPNSDYGTRDFPLPEGQELAILERYRGRIPDSVFTEPFEPSKTDGSGRIRRELRRAQELFAEAGYEVKGGRLVDAATGRQLSLEIAFVQEDTLRYIQPYIENLKKAGIDARARQVDSAQYERLTDTYDYDMLVIGANFFPPPGEELRTYFQSSAADEDGTGNWAGIKDPVIDELLNEIADMPRRTEEDLERLKATTRALDRILLAGHYIVPTYYARRDRFAYWNLFGMPDERPVYGTGAPGTWWWAPDPAALRATGR